MKCFDKLKIMSASLEELLIYGYIRKYFDSIKQELPPNDIILLFVSWIILMDTFDRIKSHKQIDFASDTRIRRIDNGTYGYRCVVGTRIVEKGDKQIWHIKCDTGLALLGVVDHAFIESMQDIDDHTSTKYEEVAKGYGVGLNSFAKCQCEGPPYNDFIYSQQFHFDDDPRLITMELDMTQKHNDNAILSYIFYNKLKEDVETVQTDGEYTRIAWDNIDIDNKYRLAISISAMNDEKYIQLLPDTPSF